MQRPPSFPPSMPVQNHNGAEEAKKMNSNPGDKEGNHINNHDSSNGNHINNAMNGSGNAMNNGSASVGAKPGFRPMGFRPNSSPVPGNKFNAAQTPGQMSSSLAGVRPAASPTVPSNAPLQNGIQNQAPARPPAMVRPPGSNSPLIANGTARPSMPPFRPFTPGQATAPRPAMNGFRPTMNAPMGARPGASPVPSQSQPRPGASPVPFQSQPRPGASPVPFQSQSRPGASPVPFQSQPRPGASPVPFQSQSRPGFASTNSTPIQSPRPNLMGAGSQRPPFSQGNSFRPLNGSQMMPNLNGTGQLSPRQSFSSANGTKSEQSNGSFPEQVNQSFSNMSFSPVPTNTSPTALTSNSRPKRVYPGVPPPTPPMNAQNDGRQQATFQDPNQHPQMLPPQNNPHVYQQNQVHNQPPQQFQGQSQVQNTNQQSPAQNPYQPNSSAQNYQPNPVQNHQQRPAQNPYQPNPVQNHQPKPASASPSKIDPDHIPSAVAVRGDDRAKYSAGPYYTNSKTLPPLSTTVFHAIDEGSCNPRFIRSTMYAVPATEEILKTSKIPLAAIIQPLADLSPTETPIPVVDFGKEGPIRCEKCQAYPNPNFLFINGGQNFVCNICSFSNKVPSFYFSNLDMGGRRIDLEQRPELAYGSCEFAVQGEYCARPPIPASYLFVVDVSWNSVQKGILETFTSSLKHFLYSGQYQIAPGAKVGIMTFDRTLHFYNLQSNLENFQMMVVSDIDDSYCPIEKGLLVDPFESRANIERLLDALPKLFFSNQVGDPVFGSACKAAFESMKKFGGKISVFQTMLPSNGEGALRMREDQALLGTEKEKSLYMPQDQFWSKLGENCAAHGVCVDMYLFPTSGYIDLATVGAVPALSGGEINFYKSFDVSLHGVKFANDFQLSLARTFGYDCVLKVRVSNGLRVDNSFGNFFMKNPTEIECAGIDSLKSFVVSLKHDGKLTDRQDLFIQAALLYTTASGNRRVRVHNLSLESSNQLSVVFRNASLECTTLMLAREMIQKSISMPLSKVRNDLTNLITKILISYRANVASASSPGQLILPESFKLGPITALTLLKTRAFRLGRIGSTDLRVYSMRLFNSISISELAHYLYPTVYNCTNVIEPNEVGHYVFPVIRASALRIVTSGIYIAENGRHMFLFVGRDVDPLILMNVFGVGSLPEIQSLIAIPETNHPHNTQLRESIRYIRSLRPRFMNLNICRQGLDPQNEARFAQLMIEDSNFDNPSYVDYLIQVHRAIQTEMR